MDSPFPDQIALLIVAGTIYAGLFLYDSYDPMNYYEERLVWMIKTIFIGLGALFGALLLIALVVIVLIGFAGILFPPPKIYTEAGYIDSMLKFSILIKLAESYAWSHRHKRGAEGRQRFRPLLDLFVVGLLYYAAMAVAWFVAILLSIPFEAENPGITVFWFPQLFPSDMINGPICAVLVLLIISITRKSFERSRQKPRKDLVNLPIKDKIADDRHSREGASQASWTSKDFILSALSHEFVDPHQAKELYHRAKKKNQEFSLLVFGVSFSAPVLASILAFNTSQLTGWQGTLLRIAILSYLGFGLPVMIRGLRDYLSGVQSHFAPRKESFYSIVDVLFAGPFFMGQQLLIALTAALLAFVVIAPFLGIILLCSDLQCRLIEKPYDYFTLEAIPLTIGLVALLVVLADIAYKDLWPPIIGARILLTGLWDNFSEVLEYFSVWTAGLILGSLESGYPTILPNSYNEAVIGGILSGLFLALAISRVPISNAMMPFIQLGLIRCNIRLHNWSSAKILFRRMFTNDICEFLGREDAKAICEYLSGHLHFVVDGIIHGYKSGFLKENVDLAAKMINQELPDKELWIQNIAENRLLVEGPAVQDILEQSVSRSRLEEMFDLEKLPTILFVLYWVAGIISFLLYVISRL